MIGERRRARLSSGNGRRIAAGLLAAGLLLPAMTEAPRAATFRFRIGDWVTECQGSGIAGCSITGLFEQSNLDGRSGSFALVVMIGSRQLAVVGTPRPLRARLQIDKNNPAACAGARYCIFPGRAARRAIDELGAGSLVLIDVYTAKDVFHSSLSAFGYQASLAKLQAEGYAVPTS